MALTLSLSGRKALLTGAGRGIGRALAHDLSKAGAEIAIVARSKDELESVKNEVEELGGKCFVYSFDLTKLVESQGRIEFKDKLDREFGEIDLLINNAGTYQTEYLEDIWRSDSQANFQESLDINLCAPYHLVSMFAPAMKAKGFGRIVNVSSISGQKAEAYGHSYSASKFGLIGLTQSLALELAAFGVTVNAICPGWVDTKLALEQLNDPTWCKLNHIEQSESVDIAKLSVPQQRLLEPSEIAWLIAFICSERAGGITGQAINICGGLSIT